jgi:site-specific DNA recombinase
VKALGYIRVSGPAQAAEGISLDAQRSRIDAWCEATGAELVEIIEDAAVSGSKPLVDRPGGSRIAALLTQRNPEVETVVIARLDRLGRDAAETLTYLKVFAKGSVGLVSIADRIDLGTPQGRAMAGVAAVFAELEKSLISQRTSEALGQLRSQGRAYGSVPYGFFRDDDRLIPDDIEQRMLARIRQLRGRGLSYDRIARSLNESGVPAKRSGNWHAMSVRSVLLTARKVGHPTETMA